MRNKGASSANRSNHTDINPHEQLTLAGFDAVPLPTDGLFFAIFPDVQTASHIGETAQRICGKHGIAVAPLALERYHVTLHHLGNYAGGLPQALVARAIRAAATIDARQFAVAFDRAENFRGRPLVLRADEGVLALMAFRHSLGAALERVGFAARTRTSFTPHVTLAYRDAAHVRRRVVEHFDEAIRWTVREFVLVHSLLGRTRHVALARWPLGA
ncbi:2'-5' RNA ligase family protein [Paraburkholderia jirisanensis]